MNTQEHASRLGPLEPLWNDPDVIGIMVDGCSRVYVERRSLGDKFEDVPSSFRDDAHLVQVINALIAPLGRKVDPSSPLVDVRLPDGSRLNAVVPPISLVGPALTMRRFSPAALTVEDLLRFGSWNEDMVTFLRACVHGRLNILVTGGTASGKTTVLNNIANMIPDDERIITIEFATELGLPQKYVVRLEPRAPDTEGKGEVTVQDLVANALHMRPDRIICGEVLAGQTRLGEALMDLFYAMNRGHEGNLIGMHANGPRDALGRLEFIVGSASPPLPLLDIRQTIASAIHLITYQERLRDGSRKVLKVAEVQGMQGDAIALQDIFEFCRTGEEGGRITGHYSATGHIPQALSRIQAAGIELPVELFTPR